MATRPELGAGPRGARAVARQAVRAAGLGPLGGRAPSAQRPGPRFPTRRVPAASPALAPGGRRGIGLRGGEAPGGPAGSGVSVSKLKGTQWLPGTRTEEAAWPLSSRALLAGAWRPGLLGLPGAGPEGEVGGERAAPLPRQAPLRSPKSNFTSLPRQLLAGFFFFFPLL